MENAIQALSQPTVNLASLGLVSESDQPAFRATTSASTTKSDALTMTQSYNLMTQIGENQNLLGKTLDKAFTMINRIFTSVVNNLFEPMFSALMGKNSDTTGVNNVQTSDGTTQTGTASDSVSLSDNFTKVAQGLGGIWNSGKEVFDVVKDVGGSILGAIGGPIGKVVSFVKGLF